jgi:DNA polymerase-3 subunit beta
MQFEINRLELLGVAKNVARVTPTHAPVPILNAILLESHEDSGELFLTATNREVSIQQKLKASIGESGGVAIQPRLLVGALSRLEGEVVSFSAKAPDVLRITDGKSIYEINGMSAKSYPKPVMPFPEETFRLSGICSLAKRTIFAIAKDSAKPVLQCVNVKIRQNAVHATACDGFKLMMVKDNAKSPDSRELLLPAQSLGILASISQDEYVFAVGDIGNEIAFVRENLLFTMRKVPGEYIDTISIVKSIAPAYTAIADAEAIRKALVAISVGANNEPANLVLSDQKIILRRLGEYSEAVSCIPASISNPTPEEGFYFNIHHLCSLFQVVNGRIRLELDAKGMICVKSRNEVYVQTPQRAPAVKKSGKKRDVRKVA